MRLIKLAIISVIVFFLIITAFSLMIPSNVRISRAINLASNEDRVLSLLQDSAQWNQWHPALMNDSTKRSIQTKFLSISDTLILTSWQQGSRQPFTNGWHIHTMSHADSLTLQWYMDFKLPWYPWKKFESLFFDKVYGSMMEQGLANIKEKIQ